MARASRFGQTTGREYIMTMSRKYPPIYKSLAGYRAVMDRYEHVVKRGPVPYESTKVSTRYGDTYVLVGGNMDGEPVMLFHGWNGNAANIGANFPFLFPKYKVFMPDIVGQSGKSDSVRPSTRGADYVNWVEDVLDQLHLPKVSLVGMSGGAWLSMKTGAYLADRVEKIATISVASVTMINWISVFRWLIKSKLYPAKSMEAFLKTNLASDIKSEKATIFAQNMELLINHYKPNLNPHRISNKELRQITSPLLVMMGEHEKVFYAKRTIQRIRNQVTGPVVAELVPDSGHVMTIDRPDYVKKRVLAFLETGQ